MTHNQFNIHVIVKSTRARVYASGNYRSVHVLLCLNPILNMLSVQERKRESRVWALSKLACIGLILIKLLLSFFIENRW